MSNQKVILLISSNRKWLTKTLHSFDDYEHIFLHAHDGHKGLEVARNDRPDVIICAEQLQDIPAAELCGLIRCDDELSGVPFFPVSENATEIAEIIRSLKRKRNVCPGSRNSLPPQHFEYYLEFFNRFFDLGHSD